MISPLTVLHTADWHLGRTLYGRKRYDEFTAFLDWLADLIIVNNITTLLVAAGVHISLKALIDDPSATPEAKQIAAGALRNLSLRPANLQALVAAGVHKQLSALLGDPQETPVAKRLAAKALDFLAPKLNYTD